MIKIPEKIQFYITRYYVKHGFNKTLILLENMKIPYQIIFDIRQSGNYVYHQTGISCFKKPTSLGKAKLIEL